MANRRMPIWYARGYTDEIISQMPTEKRLKLSDNT